MSNKGFAVQRRTVLTAGGLVVAGGALAACGDSGSSTAAPAASASTAATASTASTASTDGAVAATGAPTGAIATSDIPLFGVDNSLDGVDNNKRRRNCVNGGNDVRQ